jgi:hypothetical protein
LKGIKTTRSPTASNTLGRAPQGSAHVSCFGLSQPAGGPGAPGRVQALHRGPPARTIPSDTSEPEPRSCSVAGRQPPAAASGRPVGTRRAPLPSGHHGEPRVVHGGVRHVHLADAHQDRGVHRKLYPGQRCPLFRWRSQLLHAARVGGRPGSFSCSRWAAAGTGVLVAVLVRGLGLWREGATR